MSFSRRGFIKVAATGAAGVTLAAHPLITCAREAPTKLAAQSLGDGMVLISGAGANVFALRGPEGALLVDGGLKSRSSELLRLALAQTGTKRVDTLFNTHWHPEQTGSNEVLGKAGTRIIAQENTKLWLGRRIDVSWREPYGPLPPKALPNKSFYTRDTLQFGSEQLDYGHLGQAHTDGDLYVYLRTANVLVAGGVVSAESWPVMDYQTGGWIGGLVGAHDRLLKVAKDDTRIVPANGPVITRQQLQTQREMYMAIFDRLTKLLVKGMGPDEAVAAQPAQEFAAQWGNPDEFVRASFRSLWGHYAPDA